MSTGAIIISSIILVSFVSFGALVMWADFEVRSDNLKHPRSARQRRRAF